ncbi:MAG: hypothetical protein J1F42_06590 [Lachnospiraceae bacterium]|nr:hypothetical protein [Lachnospiraceae bacterium]
MKKSMRKLSVLILMATVLLCGCQANSESADVSAYYENLSKAQEIAVIPANASAEIEILIENKDIVDFVVALDMEHWELKSLPKAAELVGSFLFSQEETIKFGQSAASGEMNSVCEILCYEEIPYLTMKVAGMEMTFKVSDTTAEYLIAYFQ